MRREFEEEAGQRIDFWSYFGDYYPEENCHIELFWTDELEPDLVSTKTDEEVVIVGLDFLITNFNELAPFLYLFIPLAMDNINKESQQEDMFFLTLNK